MSNPVAGLKVSTPTDREIVMTRTFSAPRQLVFEAMTNCEHLKRWWGPPSWSLPVCEIDLRVGGQWRYLMRSDGGEEMGMYGEFREIQRPARIVQTENFEGDWFEPMGGGSVNTAVLEERDGRTFFSMTALYKSKEARDRVLQFPMAEGAEESFRRLDEVLETLRASQG